MKDLKKNLLYWGVTFEKLALAMFAGILVYVLVMTFMGGGITAEEIKHALLRYVWMFVFISVFTNSFSASLNYFPLTISLGSTRRASFTAMQIMQHLILVQYLLIAAVSYYAFDRELFFSLIKGGFALIGAVLVLIALANLTCICSVKFGKGVGVAVYICSLILVVVLFVVILLSAGGDEEVLIETLRSFIGKPYLFIIAVLIDAVSIGIYYRVMKKHDLQF